MIVKRGRFGQFLACSGYPECKNTMNIAGGTAEAQLVAEEVTDIKCTKCGQSGEATGHVDPSVVDQYPMREVRPDVGNQMGTERQVSRLLELSGLQEHDEFHSG